MHSNPSLQSKTAIAAVLPPELQYFDKLPDSAHVPIKTVRALYGCSTSTVWRRVRTGEIVEPVRLGSRTTRWNVGALRQALSNTSEVAK